jgi:hypothetical protein
MAIAAADRFGTYAESASAPAKLRSKLTGGHSRSDGNRSSSSKSLFRRAFVSALTPLVGNYISESPYITASGSEKSSCPLSLRLLKITSAFIRIHLIRVCTD